MDEGIIIDIANSLRQIGHQLKLSNHIKLVELGTIPFVDAKIQSHHLCEMQNLINEVKLLDGENP